MLVVNKTKCTQVVYEHNSSLPDFIHPGMIIKAGAYKNLLSEFFIPFSVDYLLHSKNVAFIRQYALGDLIQLIAACRNLKANTNISGITIITCASFVQALQPIYGDFKFMEYAPGTIIEGYDLIFVLDGMLETDHSTKNVERGIHRVDIYLQNFGLNFPCQKNYELWKPSKFIGEMIMGKYEKPVIGLQIRGSGIMKTLPYDYIKKLAGILAEKYMVILLDQEKDKGFEGKSILNMCGKMSVHQCVSAMTQMDAVITMDSGMLWMAHAANCPVLTLLGSTREHERLSLHPQYPEKAKSVNIAEMVGCSPCFETRIRCKGKVNCMNAFNRDTLTCVIMSKIQELLGAKNGTEEKESTCGTEIEFE